MPDLLVELGCEELPAAACIQAEAQLPGLLERELSRVNLAAGETRVHVAPRRLAVLALDLPAERPAERRETRGPRANAPEHARAGFARKHGIAPDALLQRDGFLWAVSEAPPAPLEEIVPELVERLVAGLDFVRTMRWDGGVRFSRPIRRLLVLLDGRALDVAVAGVRSGERSFGRRFGGGDPAIRSPRDYLEDLRAAGVLADAAERRATIVEGLDARGPWSDPNGKLDEVVYLVESPAVLEGRFNRRYLELPERVTVTAMQSHQRYFPVAAGDALEPRFLFVANGGDPELVVRGNEEVLVGRLEDAAFAERNDRRRGLAGMAVELARVSFLEGGGSLADKASRLGPLIDLLCEHNAVGEEDRVHARRAAELAKADLVSSLVSEFADLQGYAGSVYARAAGEPEPVCRAIEEHYRPLDAGGATPETLPGALLAVADKADTVAVAFALGAQPTGSRDPLGLRRAAAGAAVIALERRLSVAPHELFELAVHELIRQGHDPARRPLEAVPDAVEFLLDRVEGTLLEEGVPVEEVRAARGSGSAEPASVAALARALHAAGRARLEALRDSYGRCVRIAARARDDGAYELRPELFSEPAESALHEALGGAEDALADLVARRDYAGAIEVAQALTAPVARLFDDVLVMAEDPAVRSNRLRLVGEVAATLRTLGDLEQLPG